jgi:sigma-E factor negative regulatory protein RseC
LIEQQARIVRIEGASAVARIGGQSGCPACDAGTGCGAGLFARLLRRKPLDIMLDAPAGAQAGDVVQLGLQESLFLRLVMRLYGLPVLALLGGGGLGAYLARMTSAGPGLADLLVLLGGVGAALAVLNLTRRASKPDISVNDITMLDVGLARNPCPGPGIRQKIEHEV